MSTSDSHAQGPSIVLFLRDLKTRLDGKAQAPSRRTSERSATPHKETPLEEASRLWNDSLERMHAEDKFANENFRAGEKPSPVYAVA